MNAIRIFWLRFQAGMHSIDAYLERQRGEILLSADSQARAIECERQATRLELQKRFA